jgi:hypothetical protein
MLKRFLYVTFFRVMILNLQQKKSSVSHLTVLPSICQKLEPNYFSNFLVRSVLRRGQESRPALLHRAAVCFGVPSLPNRSLFRTMSWQRITCVRFLADRPCGLVVRVLGYRSGGSGSIPGTTRRKKVVGLERGPLSLVSTTEELLDRKVAAPV